MDLTAAQAQADFIQDSCHGWLGDTVTFTSAKVPLSFLVAVPAIARALQDTLVAMGICDEGTLTPESVVGGGTGHLMKLTKLGQAIQKLDSLRAPQTSLDQNIAAAGQISKEAAAHILDKLEDHMKKIHESLDPDHLKDLLEAAEKEMTTEMVAHLLKLSQSAGAKEYYDSWKTLKNAIIDYETSQDDFQLLAEAKRESYEEVVGLFSVPAHVSQCIATITASQAVGRPLKQDETRNKVCLSCVSAIKIRVANLEASADNMTLPLPAELLSYLLAEAGF